MTTLPIRTPSSEKPFLTYSWLYALRGVATIVLGALLLWKTGSTLLVLTQFLGAYWLVDGVLEIITAIRGGERVRMRGWLAASGILGILAGVAIFAWPLLSTLVTLTVLVYFIAFQAIFGGVVGIVQAVRVRKEIENEWTIMLFGALSILLGILLVLNPFFSLIALAWTAGALAIVGGIMTLAFAYRLHSWAEEH